MKTLKNFRNQLPVCCSVFIFLSQQKWNVCGGPWVVDSHRSQAQDKTKNQVTAPSVLCVRLNCNVQGGV